MKLQRAILIGASLAVVFTFAAARLDAQMSHDEGVMAAVLDYVEGIYEVQPDRIRRSVHPTLRKIGYMSRDGENYQSAPMTFDELVELAGGWNASGEVDAKTALKEVEILDVMNKTASAKLTAVWGVDLMHLVEIDGRWMIINVLWQTPPPDGHR